MGEERRAGKGKFKEPEKLWDDILARSVFRFIKIHDVPIVRNWDTESIIGYLFSTSSAAPYLFGDRVDRFKEETKNTLLSINQKGAFQENAVWHIVLGSKKSIEQKQLVKEIKLFLAKGVVKSTVVEMQSEYEHDDQTCLTSLVFIPKNIAHKITKIIIEPLRQLEPKYYYYPAESMHLTIKSIRTIHKLPLFTENDAAKVDRLFKKIIPKFRNFSFQLEDLVKFPTSLSLMGYCNDTLQKLVKELDAGLKQIGVPDNKKYFSDEIFFGNITLCRFTHQPSEAFVKKVKELENIKIGKLVIDKINLIICNLVCHPKTRRIVGTYRLND